uniref:Large ribosomal subunit protein bL12 C-terminal domain-containing protein n=1 Tax=Aegilops tauschii subsp. strangulata TaxID=200361 RepID=A0A453NL32_AEGTS
SNSPTSATPHPDLLSSPLAPRFARAQRAPGPAARDPFSSSFPRRARSRAPSPAAGAGSQSLVSSPSFAIFLCQYLVDGRMSLSSIARRLCCSRQSSTSRLSVVLARLHSTEAAKDTGAKRYKYPEVYDPYGPMPPASEKVVGLADRIAALPPEEIKQIAPALLLRLNQPAPQAISGQGFSMGSQGGAGAGAAKSEEKKAEKLVFDVKLEKFEAAAKIKIIKEIRTFTDLGLKDAKELVEKAPVILKQSLTKEEAEAIIAKIKAAGGVAVME